MPTLIERLQEVMTAMHWEHADVVRVSKQSSSVVSQWLGKGSKTIQTIGKLEAAIYIERETGFSALWIAKGLGPKRVAKATAVLALSEPAAPYLTSALVLEHLGHLLARVPPAMRSSFADVLHGWARDGGANPESRCTVLLAILESSAKQQVNGA